MLSRSGCFKPFLHRISFCEGYQKCFVRQYLRRVFTLFVWSLAMISGWYSELKKDSHTFFPSMNKDWKIIQFIIKIYRKKTKRLQILNRFASKNLKKKSLDGLVFNNYSTISRLYNHQNKHQNRFICEN